MVLIKITALSDLLAWTHITGMTVITGFVPLYQNRFNLCGYTVLNNTLIYQYDLKHGV